MTILGIPLRVARAAVTVVVVLDLLALLAFAFHTRTVVTKTIVPQSNAAPQSPVTAPTPQAPLPVPGGGGGITGVPVSATQPHQHAPATHHKVKAKVHHHHGGSSGSTPPSPPIPPDPPVAKCPVKMKEPAQTGGLKSLISLAPAFGPFAAEAFAAASAYQPELELLGPILARYPALAPKVAPLLDPLLTVWESGLNQFFTLINPYYAPHRKQVLDAETKLATFFAPYSEKLAGSPLAGCVIDLEAALTGDTKPGSAKSARVVRPRHGQDPL